MCQAWGESAAHSHTRSRARTAAGDPLAPAAAAAPRFSSWQREPSGCRPRRREPGSGLRGVGSRRADRAGVVVVGGCPRGRVLRLRAQPRGSPTPRAPSLLPPAARVHSSRGAPGLGADRVGVGTVAPLAASLGGAPRDTRSKTPLWLPSGSGPGALYLFIYFSLPLSPGLSPFVSGGCCREPARVQPGLIQIRRLRPLGRL